MRKGQEQNFEIRLAKIEVKLGEAIENHIAHLDEKVEKLTEKMEKGFEIFREKMDRGMWLGVTTVTGVAVTLVYMLLTSYLK